MTGFARNEGRSGSTQWSWEMRAVNGKGLDVRLRLPPGTEHLEQVFRKACAGSLARGNVQVALTMAHNGGEVAPTVNSQALQRVLSAINEIDENAETARSSAAQILALRGVLDVSEPQLSDEEGAVLDEALTVSFNETLKSLNEHRAVEGRALAEVLLGHIEKIQELTAQAEADPARSAKAIAERMSDQVGKLMGAGSELDEARLHQEVALLATKADIREELDRLAAHSTAARDLIASGSPVGRKLEFLAQEFNRECNTLCSKSNAVSLTAIGLELKVVIDQFREQILNVE